jgi:hypothetical protein
VVKVALRLGHGQPAQPVIAAEFDDYDLRMLAQHGRQAGHRILGGGAAGPHVLHVVRVPAGRELFLQEVGIRLP